MASLWSDVTGCELSDDLLAWPPNLVALTQLVIDRAHLERVVMCPPADQVWPPPGTPMWADTVQSAAREYSRSTERGGSLPPTVTAYWAVVRARQDTPVQAIAEGQPWELCVALLTLHAIADEACAGIFVALDRSDGIGCLYRARARELLARTGTLATVCSERLRVLPIVNTPPRGRERLARYASIHVPGVPSRWHKLPARYPGTDLQTEHVNLLLLPWPLRVRERDFQAVHSRSTPADAAGGRGFFQFDPAESLDLDLVDRVVRAAKDEVGSIDVVTLPECAVDAGEVDALESVLDHHGVIYLQAGVRRPPESENGNAANWLHIGVNSTLQKGIEPTRREPGGWFHLRQNKQNRWSLDATQIGQYHLGGALHPGLYWQESIDVPLPSLELLQVGEEITIVSLVCEDLARSDDLADLIRKVGPTIVVTLLLDGPQLASRWAARYASVLADDPGSAVLTLTSLGMVQRCRPRNQATSSVVALWKDPVQGLREIPLEANAEGVVLTICGDRSERRCSDGRAPIQTGTRYYDVAVHQVHARRVHPHHDGAPEKISVSDIRPSLDAAEVTVLTGWAELAAEAAAFVPQQASTMLDHALDDEWRANLHLPGLPCRLSEAVNMLRDELRTAGQHTNAPNLFAGMLAVTQRDSQEADPLCKLARRVLRSAAEQLATRLPALTRPANV